MDPHTIGKLLLETGRLSKDDYSRAVRKSRKTGRSASEILVMERKISVDELVQAIIIHLDTTLLKESLGMDNKESSSGSAVRSPTSYLERISLLFKMGTLMSEHPNIGALVDLLIREAPSVMNAERATIFLADHRTQELYVHLGVGVDHDQIRIPWNSGIAGWVFENEEPLNISAPYSDPRFHREADSKTGFRTNSILCAPLRAPRGPVLGVFQVLNKRAGVFTKTDLDILVILASQAARFIEKALEWDDLRKRASKVKRDDEKVTQHLMVENPLDRITGTSAAIWEIRTLIEKVAPTNTTVLIQGESGTGKEVAARAIQQLSPRADRPFISLNCAAVPSELIESELFGHKKGAFTGAVADHIGVFGSAHTGTLFLDEIEAMSPSMQVKLLRSLQSGEVKPVGESESHVVDVRLIASTNQDLQSLVQEGRFRQDLFYRIDVFSFIVPPLRERLEDVPPLVHEMLNKLNVRQGKLVKGVDPAAMELLLRYQWPGNVRELENEMERAHLLAPDSAFISVGCLSSRITGASEGSGGNAQPQSLNLKEAVADLEQTMIRKALEDCNGNQTLAARRLGLSRQGLINKMHRYGIS